MINDMSLRIVFESMLVFVAFVVLLSLFSFKQLPQITINQNEHLQSQNSVIERIEETKYPVRPEIKVDTIFNGVNTQRGNFYIICIIKNRYK